MSTQHPEALAQECADYATSLRSAANVAKLEGRAPPVSFLRAADLFERAASRITDLEAQLEAIGAGGVSGPLIGQPQAMPDLSQLTERGAKAWAGVDAQGLREGLTAADIATAAAQGFRDGVASLSAQAEGWTRLPGTLPEPGMPVLLDIGKRFAIRALWAEKHTVRVGTDVDDWGEYDEETDEYYCPEGWYEWNEHEDVHWAVSETPRAWSELPQPLPAAPGPADGESNG